MAAAGRWADPGMTAPACDLEGIEQRLQREPERFDVFQAIRLLEMAACPPDQPVDDSDEALYEKGDPTPIRFHATATLGFPQGAVTAVRRTTDADGDTIHVDLACFGLIGPGSPLPQHYTALIVERARHQHDVTLRDFLDVFLQQLATQYYNAWAKYRPLIQYERAFRTGQSAHWDETAVASRDGITAAITSLVGLATGGLAGRLAVDDDSILRYAAHYSRQPRCPESLGRLLTERFGVAARVVSFVGRWLELEPSDQTVLADRARPQGLNCQLGAGAVAGRRVWDVTSTFEVAIGPLSATEFAARLPGQTTLAAVGDLIRLYAGPEYEIRVRLFLAGDAVPPCQIGTATGPAGALAGNRLGWTTWLPVRSPSADRGDAVFAVG